MSLGIIGCISIVPTDLEKAALAGTSGTPSGANKYVTDADSRNTNARTPTAHHTTHEPGGSDVITGVTPAVHGADKHTGIIGTWAQIDKTTSNISDITTRSHTALTDIGSKAHSEIDGLFTGASTITGLYCARTDGVVPSVEIKGDGDAYNFSGFKLSSDEATDKYWAWYHRKNADLLNGMILEYFDGSTYTQYVKISPTGQVGIGRAPGKTLDVNGYIRGNGIFNLKNDAPADGDLANGEVCWWFDKTVGAAKIMFKAKNNSGTVVTGSVTLS